MYVQNGDKFVYKLTMKPFDVNNFAYLLEFELVAGWDYINPDENDMQGYVGKDNFVDDAHYKSEIVYLMNESINERLNELGYKVIKVIGTNLSDANLGLEQFVLNL